MIENKGLQTDVFKRIVPLKSICGCGRRVTDHHKLCNRCWGTRARLDYEKAQVIKYTRLSVSKQKNQEMQHKLQAQRNKLLDRVLKVINSELGNNYDLENKIKEAFENEI